MSKNTNLDQDVLAYLQENEDKQFRCSDLAKEFKVSAASIRLTLSRLNVEVGGTAIAPTYFLRSNSEKKRIIEALANKSAQRERPKICNRAMSIAMDRCKELYPSGGNFKSIS